MSTKLRRTATMFLTVLLLLQAVAVPAAGQRAPIGDAPSGGAAAANPDTLYSISGRVVDGSGNGVAGVTVTATRTTFPYSVILLPGIMGSNLANGPDTSQLACATRFRDRIWLNFAYNIEPYASMQLPALYLAENGIDSQTGCDSISAVSLIDEALPVSWFKDVYHGFAQYLEAQNFSVVTFPYDWRLSIEANADQLHAFIAANKGEADKVILVGHSMGGFIAREYVSNQERASQIAKVITIGTPYLGAPKAAYVMLTGQADLVPTWLRPLLAEPQSQYVKQIIRNSPGAMYLLPSRSYFSYGPYYAYDGIMLSSYDNTASYFAFKGQNRTLINDADTLHQSLDDFNHNYFLDGDYYALAARHIKTVSSISESDCFLGRCYRTSEYLLGDGTVPDISSRLRVQGGALVGPAKVCVYETGSVTKEHHELLADSIVRQDVLDILLDRAPGNCQIGSQAVARNGANQTGFREIGIWGNAKVKVSDSAGNEIGLNEDGLLENELPDVTYDYVPGGIVLTMPLDATYRVEITSENQTVPQITLTDFDSEGNELPFKPDAQNIFINAPAGIDAVLNIDVAGAPLQQVSVQVSSASTGQISQTLVPDAILTDPVKVQDRTMPTTTLTVQGPQNNEGAYTGPVIVSLAAVDDNSGVLKSYLSLDNGQTWQEYSASVEVQPGQATAVQAYTVDKAGNQEYPPQERTLTFASVSSLYLPVVTRGVQQLVGVRAETSETEFLRDTQSLRTSQIEILPVTRFVDVTISYTATTGADGRYTIGNLPTGTYEVSAIDTSSAITPTKITVTLPEDATNVDFTTTGIPVGLIAYYSFDDGTATDQSGNGNHGTLHQNPTAVPGLAGQALRFGGFDSPSFVVVPNSPSLSFVNDFTFSVWFNIRGNLSMDAWGHRSESGTHAFLAKTGDRSGITLAASRSPDQKWYPWAHNGQCCGAISKVVSSGIGTVLDGWHMLSITHGEGTVKLFLDGLLQDESTSADFNLNPSMATRDIYLGVDYVPGVQVGRWYPFNGDLDDVRIYNRSLSEAEILELYRHLVPGLEK